jgi:hypothetical protein
MKRKDAARSQTVYAGRIRQGIRDRRAHERCRNTRRRNSSCLALEKDMPEKVSRIANWDQS